MVKVWLTLALCALVGMPTWVHAQVWGYVDDRGVAHFAAERLDERYELFYKGDMPPVPLTAFFEISTAYKAVRYLIREAARTHGVDARLLQAMIAAESGFDAQAVSQRGAVGLMQIMPATAREHGLKARHPQNVETLLADPRTNIHTGARIMARLLARYPGQPELALAAYNAGEGAVRRAGQQVPPIAETRRYVQSVMQIYHFLQPPRALQARGREVSATWANAAPPAGRLSSAHPYTISSQSAAQPLGGGATGRHSLSAP
jgi:hypothetical protein